MFYKLEDKIQTGRPNSRRKNNINMNVCLKARQRRCLHSSGYYPAWATIIEYNARVELI
jgi:hypothetical protein